MPSITDYSIFSHQVLDVCSRVRAGERVWIHSWDHTVELASRLAWESTKRGCETFLTLQPEDLWLRSVEEGPLELLDKLSPQQSATLKETDVYIFTLGPRTPMRWERIPAERRKAVTLWFLEQNRFVQEWKHLSRSRKVRMVGIEATLATPERANVIGLDFKDWQEVMYAGCMADYREIASRARQLASRLKSGEEVRLTTPHGTNFNFRLANREVIIGDGLATDKKAEMGQVTFLPTGGVEVSADEASAEGTIVYDLPILSPRGQIKQLSLTIVDGRVTKYTARKGSHVFRKYLDDTEADADRFAAFGFGLNRKLRYGFTQDDKVLGAVVVNFGDNRSKGGRNRAERDFWGCMTRATVEIGERILMKDGKLFA